MTLNEFINKYNGQQIADPWGGYVGECVSLWKRYAQEVQDINPGDLFVPDGRAKNIWHQFTPNMAKHYEKVSSPQVGDAAVYDGTYGDVAVYIGNGQVFGQLGTPVFKPAAIRGVGSPLGYIRNKSQKGNEEIMNNGDVVNMYRVVLGREPDQSGLASYVGKSWHDVFYALANSPEYANRQQTAFKTLEDLKVALANELNKPPKEIVKEVEKIVEKEVIKEVVKEVPVVDPTIHTKLDKIINILKVLPAWVGRLLKGKK